MSSVRHHFALRAHPGVLLLVLAAALALAPWQAEAQSPNGRSSHTGAEVTRLAHASESVLVLGSGYREGGSGEVRSVQRRLSRAGFDPGPIDGLYGLLTTRAVTRFQQSQGIAVDGKVGPQTRRALRSPLLEPGSGYQQGGSGEVRTLQRELAHRGFQPGPVDGLYGPQTTRAVVRFQQARHLAADGVAGPLTQAELPTAQRARTRSTRERAKPASGGGHERAKPASRGGHERAKPTSGSSNERPKPAKAPPPPKTAPVEPSADHAGGGNENTFALLFILAIIATAVALVWLGTRTRRRRSIPRRPRRTHRKRRRVGDRAIARLMRLGFRYDYVRHAYVMTGLGARWGPVFEHWPEEEGGEGDQDGEPASATPIRPSPQPAESRQRSNRFRPPPERRRQAARERGDRR
ncbi:MAG TPA: peptidoglycan-binding protein [Thermoleophilaceae bacterium]